MMLYSARSKSTSAAFLFWFFLGQVAGHRFYFGKTRSAVIWLVFLLISIVTSVVVIGLFGLLIICIQWVADGFMLTKMVRKYNEDLAMES